MSTSELIEFLKTSDLPDDQLCRIVTADMEQFIPEIPEKAMRVAEYYAYKIESVLLPVIRAQREKIGG